MPRTGQGGTRQGSSGQAYPNRSDLNTQPIQADPAGRPYGERQAQEEAQRQIPLPAQRPVAAPQPGMNGPLARASQRPNEPVTAGLGIGAGPGPEGLLINQGTESSKQLLNQAAAEMGDPTLAYIASLIGS